MGPFSPALRVGNLVFISGQIGVDPKTGKVVQGGIREQTRQTLENIRALLEAAGASIHQVVKCFVYLSDIRDWAAMNEVYREYFKKDPPCRTTVEAKLFSPEVLVEITPIAVIPG